MRKAMAVRGAELRLSIRHNDALVTVGGNVKAGLAARSDSGTGAIGA